MTTIKEWIESNSEVERAFKLIADEYLDFRDGEMTQPQILGGDFSDICLYLLDTLSSSVLKETMRREQNADSNDT